jgi:hypothetical protein
MRPVPAGSGRARPHLCFRWPRKSTKTAGGLLASRATWACFRICYDAALTAMPRPYRDVRRNGSVGTLKVRSRRIDASRPRHAAVARLWRRRLGCPRYRETGATRRRRIRFGRKRWSIGACQTHQEVERDPAGAPCRDRRRRRALREPRRRPRPNRVCYVPRTCPSAVGGQAVAYGVPDPCGTPGHRGRSRSPGLCWLLSLRCSSLVGDPPRTIARRFNNKLSRAGARPWQTRVRNLLQSKRRSREISTPAQLRPNPRFHRRRSTRIGSLRIG